MKSETETQIAELRSSGLGYKRIAETMGIPVSTVKSICYRNGLNAPAPIISHSKLNPSVCKQCGRPLLLLTGRKPKQFCSSTCRMKWWNVHTDQMRHKTAKEQKCYGCGVVLHNPRRKYCSRSCYLAHRFRKGQD